MAVRNVRGLSMSEREHVMMELARQLQFQVEKHGSKYLLRRVADVSVPVEEKSLTLEKAEELLNTWKLRGFHGG
jgi:hypothetical protein